MGISRISSVELGLTEPTTQSYILLYLLTVIPTSSNSQTRH